MGGCCNGAKKVEKQEDATPPTLDPLEKGKKLAVAQTMTKTKNGKPINRVILANAMSDLEAKKSQSDPEISEDMRTIFKAPFNVCNKLTSYVYLSGIASLTKENLETLQINLIINATYEWPKVCPTIHGKEVVNIRVPVDDSGQDDISIYFDEVSDKINENADKGGRTLIHCMAGASRSTTLVLAYLMKYENISLLNAYKSVKKRREPGRPNIGFWDQLLKYEIRIRGKASGKMIKEKYKDVDIMFPDFYKTQFPDLFKWEAEKQWKELQEKKKDPMVKTNAEKVYNPNTKKYE